MQATLIPTLPPAESKPARHRDDEIKRRLDACPKLASLQTINRALRELINSEQSLNSQIAEIIRRDPSLSARLLRMVNSVYFGNSTRISNIEEAVFFLGLRQIRELSTATPVIEEMQTLHPGAASGLPLPWTELWRHSIGTAALTREILFSTNIAVDDDTDYLAGLLHNVGKVVMAYAFPEELQLIMATPLADPAAVCALERELIGWDHARIGAYYLGRHQLSDEITFAVLYHNEPDRAPRHRQFAAAVQVADQLVRHVGISGGFEIIQPIAVDSWLKLDGWKILYGADGSETALARAHLANALQRLPTMLQGLV
jgi:HD-like signal output (HDOD) protein